MVYLVLIRITSDSGVGPYQEKKYVANCRYIQGIWYCDDKTGKEVKLFDCFCNRMADFELEVLSFEPQKAWYY